jgi:hypothetical protein
MLSPLISTQATSAPALPSSQSMSFLPTGLDPKNPCHSALQCLMASDQVQVPAQGGWLNDHVSVCGGCTCGVTHVHTCSYVLTVSLTAQTRALVSLCSAGMAVTMPDMEMYVHLILLSGSHRTHLCWFLLLPLSTQSTQVARRGPDSDAKAQLQFLIPIRFISQE